VKTVLGLALTSTDVCWALLAGDRATDDAILDDDAFMVDNGDELVERSIAAARGAQAIAASSGHEVRSVAVTADDDTVAEAGKLIESLKSAGFDDVRIVPSALVADSELSAAHSAAHAVVTDAVPAAAAPCLSACGRPAKWLWVSGASAAAVVIGVVAAGALFFVGDPDPAPAPANLTTAGSLEIVTAAIPRLTPPTIAVHPRDVQPARHVAKLAARPESQAPTTRWTPPAAVPAKPVTPASPPVDVLRREVNPPAPPAGETTEADTPHLPQNLLGPAAPGPADAVASAAAPASTVAQGAQGAPAPMVAPASPAAAPEVPAAPAQTPTPQAPSAADPLDLFGGLP
jgi:hypothetical protein